MASNPTLAAPAAEPHPIRERAQQSPPIDLSIPYSTSWLKGKTILVTGGASGFGAGFCREWAAAGANVFIGDIDDKRAEELVAEIRTSTGNQNVHFVHCDVTDWDSQVSLFRRTVELSPHGGIDIVVANAGVATTDPFMLPKVAPGSDEPQKPNFKIININLIGVMYTAHLAFFHLPRNPGAPATLPANPDPEKDQRDKCLLLIGSLASLEGAPGQAQYSAAKHGVLGLFRSLRSGSFAAGMRVNLICPYFIDTPILPAMARALLAGGATGKPEDVVDAGSRLVADTRIRGRALVVGPKVKVRQKDDGQYELVEKADAQGKVEERAVWEPYAHDFEDSDTFSRSFVGLLNTVTAARGWAGWASDMFAAVKYAIAKRELVRR